MSNITSKCRFTCPREIYGCIFFEEADGFIFEPATSLKYIVEHYGKSKVIIGNADCRILQFGTKEDIKNEVQRCIELGRECPGYFMAVGNHIPYGIPLEHVEYYFETFDKLRNR